MDKFNSYLTEWMVHYIKNKDLLTKNVESIEENKENFELIVNFKGKKQYYIVKPFIENINDILEKLNDEDFFSLVLFNTKENFKIIISNWDNLAKFKKLSLFFVNPFSKLDKRWIVYPHTHSNISEKGSLETGLKTMFQTVESINQKELDKKISL